MASQQQGPPSWRPVRKKGGVAHAEIKIYSFNYSSYQTWTGNLSMKRSGNTDFTKEPLNY